MRNRLFSALLLLMFVIGYSPAYAQEGAGLDLLINQVSTLETPDALQLKAYFTLYDPKTSLPNLDVVPTTAQVNLPQYNYTVEAPVTRPDVPIYVVLVLDASGSMGGVASDLQKAAKQALTNTPDNSQFAVVQFDEEIKLLQDFTSNISAVTFAIEQYKVSPGKGTCLYDATYTAIETLQKAQAGRRSVIVFTDGKDENPDGKQCSKHSFHDLLSLAMNNQVPVNTIGLSFKEGNLNQVELNGLASSTGGFAAVVRQDSLIKAFSDIMDVLKAQWMVYVDVYPHRGESQVLLTVPISETESISKTFSIKSNTDYPGPPSKVQMRVDGLVLNAAKQVYDLQLSLTSFELVQYVKVEVWDKSANTKLNEYVFEQPQNSNVFPLPTTPLTPEKAYVLHLSAVSPDGVAYDVARTDDGLVKQILHEFTFDPSSSYPTLQIQSVSQENYDLLVSFSMSNTALAGSIAGWLVNEESATKVKGSDFVLTQVPAAGEPLLIPLRTSRVPRGKYTVIIRVLAKDGSEYSKIPYSGVVYTAPTIMQRVWLTFVAAPWLPMLLLLILIVAVWFAMRSTRQQKVLSGTPVLDGKMGASLSGKPLPLADDEPLLKRKIAVQPQIFEPIPTSSPETAPKTVMEVPESAIITTDFFTSSSLALILTLTDFPQGLEPVSYTVSTFPAVIGRTGADIQINEQHISRRHAQLEYSSSERIFLLKDLGSSNGTFLGAQRLLPNQPTPVSSGSVIRFGQKITLLLQVKS